MVKDSFQNAEKVKLAIIHAVKKITTNPAIHSPDKFKIDNDGNCRAFELYHYRVSYFVGKTEIRILRVKHTSMQPLVY